MTAAVGLKDLKAALGSNAKPDITHVRLPFMIYTARACTYGNRKYERANYQRRASDGPGPARADVERFRAYLRAAASHIWQVLDAIEAHQANDPAFEDVEGFKRAAFAVDTDPGNEKVGPSLLPHISPACSSLCMAVTQAVQCGLLPADPGCPWEVAEAEEKVLMQGAHYDGHRSIAAQVAARNAVEAESAPNDARRPFERISSYNERRERSVKPKARDRGNS